MWPFDKGKKSCQEEIRKNGKVKARHVIQQDQLYIVCKWYILIHSGVAKQRILNKYHSITCKSQWIIHLLECILCNIQYVGKSETSFNLRLNNHRKDVSNPKAFPSCAHFIKEEHKFYPTCKVYFNRATNRNDKC